MIWVRWSLPRFRIDQVMYLCYKVLLPWSVVCVVGAALQVLLGGAGRRARPLADGEVTVRARLLRQGLDGRPHDREGHDAHVAALLHEADHDPVPRGGALLQPLRARACTSSSPTSASSATCARRRARSTASRSRRRAPARPRVLTKYEIDYAKCLFCALCVDPCPVDCIHMGQQYDLAVLRARRRA